MYNMIAENANDISNYKNCIYLMINETNKTYYCGRAEDLHQRFATHKHKPKLNNNSVFILEENCICTTMEYVWLYFFKNMYKEEWTCLNQDFNTGNRFKVCSKMSKIDIHDIKSSNYFSFCKSNLIPDLTGIIL